MKSDIFELLQKNALSDPNQAALPVVSIWNVATYHVMFFTLKAEVFRAHYDDAERISYHCLGDGCPACSAGIRWAEHIYMPAWDVAGRRVLVLKFHTGDRGPAPKFLEFLHAYGQQLADVVALIKCDGKGAVTITAHKTLPETDRGALACETFCRAAEAGRIDLRTCAKQLSAEEMVKLPSVHRCRQPIMGDPLGVPSAPTALICDAVPPRSTGEGV